jgi:hypothetical protein
MDLYIFRKGDQGTTFYSKMSKSHCMNDYFFSYESAQIKPGMVAHL